MSRPTIALSPIQINNALGHLPNWQYKDNALIRIVDQATYLTALELVNKIGLLAESLNHHPDIFLQYKKITIKYWTHTAQGVTQLDIEAAEKVESLISNMH